MSNPFKNKFISLIQIKKENNYSFFEERIEYINGKPFKYLSFNIDREILNCACTLAKEKSNYTMDENQASEVRDTMTKLNKCAQGILAEMFVHLLLEERYGFKVLRYDLERETFAYSPEEYDLKICINNTTYEVESRSSNIHHNSLSQFISNDVIIGPYWNKLKEMDDFADFHFRPIYLPSFLPFVNKNGKLYANTDMFNGKVKLIITGVATKEEFKQKSFVTSLGQIGTNYYVVKASDIGDIDIMDIKLKKLNNNPK